MSEMRPGAETRRFGRSASLLSAGVGVAGLLTYLFFSLASHNLDATEYGEIVVLWSAVFVTISVAYRPVEQLLSRTLADRIARGDDIGAGDPHSRADPADGLGRACRGDPAAARPASGQPPLRLGDALLGAVRLRRRVRRIVLRPGLPRRHAALHAPRGAAGDGVRGQHAVRARFRARHRRRPDGGRAGSRGSADGEPHARPRAGADAGRARKRSRALQAQSPSPPVAASQAPCW